MCGRFALNEISERFVDYFQLADDLELLSSWNIAPTSLINAITADTEGRRHIHKMRWGLIPSWAKDISIGNKLTNARGETVAEKPSFKSAFKYRRCLIPASGFYEWTKEKSYKQPWYISLKSGTPLAFAGLWETWHPKKGEFITSCCIITTSANSLMEPIHDRMPVILDPDHWPDWLSPQENQSSIPLQMIRPCDPESLQAWPVTRELNRVGLRDDAELTDRISITS